MDPRTQLLRDALERNTRPVDYARLLLYDVVQTFLPVPEDMRERYQETLAKEEYRHLREYETTWAETDAEGIPRRQAPDAQAAAREQVRATFPLGPLGRGPHRCDRLAEPELDGYLEGILTARCLSDLGLDR